MHGFRKMVTVLLLVLGVNILFCNQVPRDTIIAEYSEGKIVYGDIEDRIAKIPAMYQTRYRTEDGMIGLLDMMCTEEVFYLEALNQNMDTTEKFQENSEMQIKSFLYNEYKNDLIRNNVSVTEEEKLNYFKEHSDDIYAGGVYEDEVVTADIENRLRSQKEQQFISDYFSEKKEQYEILVNEDIIQQIELENLENNSELLQEKIITSNQPQIEKDVNYLLSIYPELTPQQQQPLKDAEGILNFVNEMALIWTLAHEAEKNGYLAKPEIEEAIEQIERNVLLRSIYNHLVIDAVQISDEDLKEYYDANIESYSNKATRKIQVFSFETEDLAEKILKKADKALKNSKEEDLNNLIKENCTYTNNNGIIGNIYDNGIVPGFGKDENFSNLIWAKSSQEITGKFTEIFPINKGEYVFFRILEDNPSQPHPFEEVMERIRSKLVKDLTNNKFAEVTAELKEKYNVITYNDRLFLVLSSEEYFNFAEEAQKKRRYQDAIYYYDKVIKHHKNGEDDYKALFMKAFLFAEELNKKDQAIELFNELIDNYEESDLHESARFMILELQGKSDIIDTFENDDQN
jgi:hypothetical protein